MLTLLIRSFFEGLAATAVLFSLVHGIQLILVEYQPDVLKERGKRLLSNLPERQRLQVRQSTLKFRLLCGVCAVFVFNLISYSLVSG